MRKLKYVSFFFLLVFMLLSCDRTKSFQEVNKKTSENRIKKLSYLEIYDSHYTVKKGTKFYIVDATITVINKSNKNIYWFKVLVNIYENGKITHAIVVTPNYYMEKDGKNYYHYLAPKQTGVFRIHLGETYGIKSYPNSVTFSIFEVGDSVDIIKKVRDNPKKYFIPYRP